MPTFAPTSPSWGCHISGAALRRRPPDGAGPPPGWRARVGAPGGGTDRGDQTRGVEQERWFAFPTFRIDHCGRPVSPGPRLSHYCEAGAHVLVRRPDAHRLDRVEEVSFTAWLIQEGHGTVSKCSRLRMVIRMRRDKDDRDSPGPRNHLTLEIEPVHFGHSHIEDHTPNLATDCPQRRPEPTSDQPQRAEPVVEDADRHARARSSHQQVTLSVKGESGGTSTNVIPLRHIRMASFWSGLAALHLHAARTGELDHRARQEIVRKSKVNCAADIESGRLSVTQAGVNHAQVVTEERARSGTGTRASRPSRRLKAPRGPTGTHRAARLTPMVRGTLCG